MSIEEHIEKGDSQKNNIVPADIVILSLISQLHSDMSDPVDGEETFTLSIDIQKVLYKFIFDYIYGKMPLDAITTMEHLLSPLAGPECTLMDEEGNTMTIADIISDKLNGMAASFVCFTNSFSEGVCKLIQSSDDHEPIPKSSLFGRFIQTYADSLNSMSTDDLFYFHRKLQNFVQGAKVSLWNERHVDAYLESQMEILSGSEASPSQDMEDCLKQVEASGYSSPRLYRFKHLYYFHKGDLEQALSSIRRYHDYCLSSKDSNAVSSAGMSLVTLLSKMGFQSEALKRVLETIPFAREAKDEHLLSQLLLWLHRLRPEDYLRLMNEPTELDVLDSLERRSLRLGQLDICVQCYIYRAQVWTKRGVARKHIESLLQKGMGFALENGSISSRNTVLLAFAKLYMHYGMINLAETYIDFIPLEGFCEISIESACLSAVIMSRKGHPGSGIKQLQTLKSSLEFDFATSALNVSRTIAQIQACHSFHQHEYAKSTRYTQKWFALCSETSTEEKLSARILQAKIKFKRGLYRESLDELAEVSKDAEHFPQVHARACITLSEILLEAHDASSDPTIALEHILIALHLCERYKLDTLGSIAHSVYAIVLLRLGFRERCIQLLKEAVPTVVSFCDPLEQAKLWEKLAFACDSQGIEGDNSKKSSIEYLRKACEVYEQLQHDKSLFNCLRKQAFLYNDLKEFKQRDEVSKRAQALFFS